MALAYKRPSRLAGPGIVEVVACLARAGAGMDQEGRAIGLTSTAFRGAWLQRMSSSASVTRVDERGNCRNGPAIALSAICKVAAATCPSLEVGAPSNHLRAALLGAQQVRAASPPLCGKRMTETGEAARFGYQAM